MLVKRFRYLDQKLELMLVQTWLDVNEEVQTVTYKILFYIKSAF